MSVLQFEKSFTFFFFNFPRWDKEYCSDGCPLKLSMEAELVACFFVFFFQNNNRFCLNLQKPLHLLAQISYRNYKSVNQKGNSINRVLEC